jgi:hypothetical protein
VRGVRVEDIIGTGKRKPHVLTTFAHVDGMQITYTHHASEDEPQYEIKSDKSDHIALHKAGALHRTTG